MSEVSTPPADSPPKWRPLTTRQRRVAGVLVEKAKTVPDSYPMTLNAITTGCNQKSNRQPQMNLDADEVQEVLDQLREMGAVGEVHGDGRVPKYRHYMYDWLGVDKYEMAVMVELLLRGEQTVGDLRSRAVRMEPIADQAALRTILQALIEKKLAVPLTPEGRGQFVTHGLYEADDLQRLKNKFQSGQSTSSAPAPRSPAPATAPDVIHELRADIEELRAQLEDLRAEVHAVKGRVSGER